MRSVIWIGRGRETLLRKEPLLLYTTSSSDFAGRSDELTVLGWRGMACCFRMHCFAWLAHIKPKPASLLQNASTRGACRCRAARTVGHLAKHPHHQQMQWCCQLMLLSYAVGSRSTTYTLLQHVTSPSCMCSACNAKKLYRFQKRNFKQKLHVPNCARGA